MNISKVRIYNPSSGKMLYDLENVFDCLKQQIAHDGTMPSRGITFPYNHRSEGMVWMLFTGYKDKFGKDIYVGDKDESGNVVQFLGGCWTLNGDRPLYMMHKVFVVAGNIYEGRSQTETFPVTIHPINYR